MIPVNELEDPTQILTNLVSATTSTPGLEMEDETQAQIAGFQVLFERLGKTPELLRVLLQNEFKFDGMVNCFEAKARKDGDLLKKRWFDSSFVLPRYKDPKPWIQKAIREAQEGRTVVMLLPSRTKTAWFHDLVLANAHSIRFIKGGMKMPGYKDESPYSDFLAIFKPSEGRRSEEGVKQEAGVAILKLSTSLASDGYEVTTDEGGARGTMSQDGAGQTSQSGGAASG